MKINEVIVEDVALDQKVNQATKSWVDVWNKEVQKNPAQAKDPRELQQFAASLAKDSSGKQLFQPRLPTQQDLNAVPEYIKSVLMPVFSSHQAAPGRSLEKSTSDFTKMFKVIDQDPITIQWKQEVFQRKDGTGQWVNFPGGKPIPQAMIVALDKVSPPLSTPRPSANPTHGGVKAISVTDNAGVVWTKDEDNNAWRSDDGAVANPANSAELEKRALTQYQARQMGS